MTAHKGKRLKTLAVVAKVAILAISPGCATRHARTQPGPGRSPPAYRDQPHLYPAIRYTWDGRVMRHGLHGQLDRIISEEISRRQSSALISANAIFYELFVGMPVLFVTGACTVIIELPASLISDTLMMPVDFAALRRFDADGAFLEEALLGTGWPVTAGEIRRRYRPANGNAVIHEFLEHPVRPGFADRVLILIEAEAGLPVLAAAAQLDAQMANRLLEQVSDEPRYRRVLELLVQNPDIPADTLTRLATLSLTPSHRYLQPLLAANPSASAAHLEVLLSPHIQEATLPADTLTALERIATHPAAGEATLARLAESPVPSVFHAVVSNPLTPAEALARMAARDIHTAQRALARHPAATPSQLEQLARLTRTDVLSAIAEHPAATPSVLLRLENATDPERRRGRDMALSLARHPATPPETLERLSQWADIEIDTALARHASSPPEIVALLAGRTDGSSGGGRLIRALAENPVTPEWFLLARSEELSGRSANELRRILARNPATPSEGLIHFVDDLRVGFDLLHHPKVTAEIVELTVFSACRPGWIIDGDRPAPLIVLKAASAHPLTSQEAMERLRARVDELEQSESLRNRYPELLRGIRNNLQNAGSRDKASP